ncbi:hypothetical protein [Hoyosella subflava]|uniref:Lipoprotein n=1 Tax=Hoyosella subflava (strain DSM 45089 / JCM 17490 / NBRC 109087 / DQS3-9A1) TaxID=443218 RepID=F6EHM1_HOYSD|nr:hypothetical protein [Hoyosella subflava]AEF42385.1 hypothetical protein AS9A_3949 [Hoyosella subflava DQS3-9A1]
MRLSQFSLPALAVTLILTGCSNNDSGSAEVAGDAGAPQGQALYLEVCADMNEFLDDMQSLQDQAGLGPIDRRELADDFMDFMRRDLSDWAAEWNETVGEGELEIREDDLQLWEEVPADERETIERAVYDAADGRC